MFANIVVANRPVQHHLNVPKQGCLKARRERSYGSLTICRWISSADLIFSERELEIMIVHFSYRVSRLEAPLKVSGPIMERLLLFRNLKEKKAITSPEIHTANIQQKCF